jgi:hypothetical protein
MIESATVKHHHRFLYALAAAAGLGLEFAFIAFCDVLFSGSGLSGVRLLVRTDRPQFSHSNQRGP